MGRKRIVFLIGQLGLGGSEKQLFILLERIDKNLFQPIVISFNPGANDYWEQPIRKLGIEIYFVIISNPLYRTYKFFKLIKSINSHILVSWSLRLNFIAALAGKVLATPVVCSIRLDLNNETTRGIKIHRWLGTKLGTMYISNSSAGKVDLITQFNVDAAKIKVIFNAIRLADFKMSDREGVFNIRDRLGVSNDTFFLLNVGRLEEGKNQKMFLEVVHTLRRDGHKVEGAIIGTGPLLTELKLQCEKFGITDSIYFLGSQPNAFNLFPAFDALCHCSRGEGMSNVLSEAMAMRTLVITTQVNGADDLIMDGKNGFVVAQDSVSSVCDAVMVVLNNKVIKKGIEDEAYRILQKEHFQIHYIVKEFEKIFNKLTS